MTHSLYSFGLIRTPFIPLFRNENNGMKYGILASHYNRSLACMLPLKGSSE